VVVLPLCVTVGSISYRTSRLILFRRSFGAHFSRSGISRVKLSRSEASYFCIIIAVPTCPLVPSCVVQVASLNIKAIVPKQFGCLVPVRFGFLYYLSQDQIL
jgi:hypothetical protein